MVITDVAVFLFLMKLMESALIVMNASYKLILAIQQHQNVQIQLEVMRVRAQLVTWTVLETVGKYKTFFYQV